MRERDEESRRLMRIERATGIERKELKIHLEKLVQSGYISQYMLEKKGRGGHPIIIYNILESGRNLRGDIGRWIDMCIRLEYYPDDFFYLPSDA